MKKFILRPYAAQDEDAAIGLWHRTWKQAYPSIDFDARLPAWRERWRTELAPSAKIVVAERGGQIMGFVTIDSTGYLDQLVVEPDSWGSELGDLLLKAAKEASPAGITLLVNADNARAIRFYERNGFKHTHDDVNPVSGRAVRGMAWTP
ncbi:MAG TPA: GNAT family N-acetyltransferase [Afipia sp.]